MVTTLGSVVPATDYSEIARRPLEAEQCALVVIDIQEKLLPPIFQKEQLVRNSQLLIRAAGILKIPALVSTQYAKGLGRTVPEIASLLPGIDGIDKTFFSCFGSDVVLQRAEASARAAHNASAVRHGEPYLRDADCDGGVARRISGTRGVGRGQLADGVELEDWAGSDAGSGRGDFVDGDDDL